ncbi:hypothetical protein NGB30_10300 [Mammaliicoccus fleurettii]|nr:hypothetical protein [Mammaliicoccus fleurettii]MEB7780931.1 hypothetical protein [Mammaliicoccus fleurettii]
MMNVANKARMIEVSRIRKGRVVEGGFYYVLCIPNHYDVIIHLTRN